MASDKQGFDAWLTDHVEEFDAAMRHGVNSAAVLHAIKHHATLLSTPCGYIGRVLRQAGSRLDQLTSREVELLRVAKAVHIDSCAVALAAREARMDPDTYWLVWVDDTPVAPECPLHVDDVIELFRLEAGQVDNESVEIRQCSDMELEWAGVV